MTPVTQYFVLTYGKETARKWWNDFEECKNPAECTALLLEKKKREGYLGYAFIELKDFGDNSSWVAFQCNYPEATAKLEVSHNRDEFKFVPV